MLLSNFIENVQCPNELKNSVEKCLQMFRNESISLNRLSKQQHHQRIRLKLHNFDNRQCDKMIKRSDKNQIKTTTTSNYEKMIKTSTSSPIRSKMATTRPIFSASSSLHRALPLRISYTAIAVVMFFIITLHSQSANGALSRDSSSIYHNNSINNIIAVTNNSIVTDDGDVDYIENVISIIDEERIATDDADVQNNNKFSKRKIRKPIYHNEFAVYIPNGDTWADSIAAKHGFSNMGQVSFLLFFFILFILMHEDIKLFQNLKKSNEENSIVCIFVS